MNCCLGNRNLQKAAACLFFSLLLLALSGCATIRSSATSNMISHLSTTIMNNDDLQLVEDGAPAYLLMVDSLISKDPENDETLAMAAQLYSAYADVFVKDTKRARKMSAKALTYAKKSVCFRRDTACGIQTMTYEAFENTLPDFDKSDLLSLFTLGQAWGGWIMANRSNADAIADLSRIEAIMKRVIDIDESYKDGAPFTYLGTLSSFLPPALGGRPEEGKAFFEKALQLSSGKSLTAKVAYAKFYARNIFDRELHDRLLKDVITSDPYVEGYTLVNIWAQEQAKSLLNEAEDYF